MAAFAGIRWEIALFRLAQPSQDLRGKDDATMPQDDVMAVDERLTRLEKTIAQGFLEQRQRFDGQDGRFGRLENRMGGLENRMGGLESRMDGLEGRMGGLESRMVRLEDRVSALDSKLDVFSETIRGDIQTVLEAITAGTDEMRRTTKAIRQEHEADRRLMKAILNDHAMRIRTLEDANTDPVK